MSVFSPYLIPFLIAIAIDLWCVGYALLSRSRRVAQWGAGIFAAVAVCSSAYLFVYGLPDIASKVWCLRVLFSVLPLLPCLWLFLVAEHTGTTDWFKPRRFLPLFIVPAITIALTWTSDSHTELFYDPYLEDQVLHWKTGFWYYVHYGYSIGIYCLCIVTLMKSIFDDARQHAQQSLMIVIALLAPLLAEFLFLLNITPACGVDYTLAVFAASACLITFVLLREKTLNIVPIALGLVIDTMSDLLLVFDHRNQLVDLNEAACQRLDIDGMKALGQHAEQILAPWPPILRRYQGTASGVETLRRLGEEECIYDISVTPVYDKKKQLMGRVVLLHNVTELYRAKAEAEAATRAKSSFLANMSHEIRTPLNVILGFAQVMSQSDTITPENRESLAMIMQSGEHLLALINEILDLSKIEASQEVVHMHVFDLHKLIQGVGDLFRHQTAEAGLAWQMSVGESVPQYVRSDEGKLRQVLVNLVANAVKFTQSGSVSLWAEVAPAQVGEALSQHVCITVKDTGPGIAPAEMRDLFQPFSQTESGRNASESTGLGLALSRRYIELLGGTLSATSEVGQGSCFVIDIALEVAAPAPAPVPAVLPEEIQAPIPAPEMASDEPQQNEETDSALTPLRILVVDDDFSNRRLMCTLLTTMSARHPGMCVEVREATDGREAVALWAQWRPQVILMDIRMPIMDGLEATRLIRQQAETSDTSPFIIAVTASAFAEERADMLANGCDDYLAKPIMVSQLDAIFAQHLGFNTPSLPVEVEKTAIPPPSAEPLTEAVAAEHLRACPATITHDMHFATSIGDFDAVHQLIERIRVNDAPLAQYLYERAYHFDQTTLLRLLSIDGKEMA